MNLSPNDDDQRIFSQVKQHSSAGPINFDCEPNFQQQRSELISPNGSSAMESGSSSCWMESVWAPPNLLTSILESADFDQPPLGDDFATPIHQKHTIQQGTNSGNSSRLCTFSSATIEQQISPHGMEKQTPTRRAQQHSHQSNFTELYQEAQPNQQIEGVTGANDELGQPGQKLIVLRQPEEQHRARYASEGSRGAIKDRSGTSFCSIQLIGFYRPTRVELFAAEQNMEGHFVLHTQYKLIPVAGKSSTMTPCKVITATDGTERLEVMLRPENGMIGILDCIGIMKICSYGINTMDGKGPVKKRKRRMDNTNTPTTTAKIGGNHQQQIEYQQQNCVYIVARAHVPTVFEANGIRKEGEEEEGMNKVSNEMIGHYGRHQPPPNSQILQAITEPIRCVQQLGNPDLLKMSLSSCPSSGGLELFIIGRNFDPKGTRILFREYKNDGSLGWNAEAQIDRRFMHQCHIVCVIPAYHNSYRNATVSITVICGTKQSHPWNFHYIACEREDDEDWRPPDCSTGTCGGGMSRNGGHPNQQKHQGHHQLRGPIQMSTSMEHQHFGHTREDPAHRCHQLYGQFGDVPEDANANTFEESHIFD